MSFFIYAYAIILFLWTISLIVLTVRCKTNSNDFLGWANIYRRFDGYIIVGAVKDLRNDCISVGRLERARSEYIGTYKIYKENTQLK